MTFDALPGGDLVHALAMASDSDTRVYLAGGATALLYGWRSSTADVDLKIVPEHDSILRAIPRLKEEPKSSRRAVEESLASAGEEKRP